MSSNVLVSSLAAIIVVVPGWAVAADCFDVTKSQPASLTGTLEFAIFAGPPNYEDVQQGDYPEAGYILKLPAPICITDGGDFADPATQFSEVQVVPNNAALASQMRENRNSAVTVQLTEPMAAMTGHHHRPLVAWVTEIAPTTNGFGTEVSLDDLTAEYGTPATMIRAFFAALHEGEGAIAASFVLPERRKGAFAADALTLFYGSLSTPVDLTSLSESGPGEFLARYTYSKADARCDGRAIVRTAVRGELNFIAGMSALDGC